MNKKQVAKRTKRKQVSKQKTDSSGRLAVVGDRELVIGYRLIGIDDTFIVSNEEDASKKILELYSSGEFGLIIASNSMRTKLSSKFLNMAAKRSFNTAQKILNILLCQIMF